VVAFPGARFCKNNTTLAYFGLLLPTFFLPVIGWLSLLSHYKGFPTNLSLKKRSYEI
jgi:hypothetical protein